MPWIKEPLHARLWSSVTDFFLSWWKEATRPFGKSGLRPAREFFRRFMLWTPAVVLLLAVVGGAGLYFFTGWRARDLARKAAANARGGNVQMARLQIASALNLRAGDPAVQRTQLYVRSRCNDPAALALWENLAAQGDLTAEETVERARLATVSGDEGQFDRAIAALEKSGRSDEAASFRSSRLLRRGNLSQSIAEARAAAASGDEAKKLDLVRLLLMRHVPLLNERGSPHPDSAAAAREIIALVDQLQGTPSGNQAIALALGAFPQPADKAREWALLALQDLTPSNPALLPAAQFMVGSGDGTARDYFAKFSPVFAGADLEQQAQFAHWLNGGKMWDETLALITAQKAGRNTAAYEERGRALAGKGQWQELLAMTEAPSQAPQSLQLTLRGLAAQKLGKTGLAQKSLSDAVRAAVPEGLLPQTLAALDGIGEGQLADPIIIESCASPGMADAMFRMARDRFGRRGQFSDLFAAWNAASQAAPDAPAVRDYCRRTDLLAGRGRAKRRRRSPSTATSHGTTGAITTGNSSGRQCDRPNLHQRELYRHQHGELQQYRHRLVCFGAA